MCWSPVHTHSPLTEGGTPSLPAVHVWTLCGEHDWSAPGIPPEHWQDGCPCDGAVVGYLSNLSMHSRFTNGLAGFLTKPACLLGACLLAAVRCTAARLQPCCRYANGVALSADESFVAVAETSRFRVLKHWLKGPKVSGSTRALSLPASSCSERRRKEVEQLLSVQLHSVPSFPTQAGSTEVLVDGLPGFP